MNGDPQKIISTLRSQGRDDEYITNILIYSDEYGMNPNEARALVAATSETPEEVPVRQHYSIESIDAESALALPEQEVAPEQQESESGWWQAIEDATSGTGLGDFVDYMGDVGRAAYYGAEEATLSTELIQSAFGYGDQEDFSEIAEAIKKSQERGLSIEAQELEKELENTEGYWSRMWARANNITATSELIAHSLGQMVGGLSEAAVLGSATAGGVVAGTAAAAVGGGVGSIVPGAGTAVGGGAGFTTGFGRGFVGGLSGAVDAQATIMGIVKEELRERGLEPTEENIQALFNDQELVSRMRSSAVTRGLVIGTVDALTMGAAGAITKPMAVAGKSALKRGAISTGVEMVGGSSGELVAQLADTGEVDWEEVTLEGLLEAPMGAVTLASNATATYNINGGAASREDIVNLINSGERIGDDINIKRDKDLADLVNETRKGQNDQAKEVANMVQAEASKRGKQLHGSGLKIAVSHAFRKVNKANEEGNSTAVVEAISEAVDHVSQRYQNNGVYDIDIDEQPSGQRSRAMGNSRYDSASSKAAALRERAKRIRNELRNASTEEERNSMKSLAQSLETEANDVTKNRIEFYRKAVLRNPEVSKAIQQIDIDNYNIEKALESKTITEEAKADLLETFKSNIEKRVALEQTLAEDMTEVTPVEETVSYVESANESLQEKQEEIDTVQREIDGLEDELGTQAADPDALEDARSRMRALQQEKADLDSLVADYKKAKEEYDIASEDVGVENIDPNVLKEAEKKVTDTGEALAAALGLEQTQETNSEFRSATTEDFTESTPEDYVAAMEAAKADDEKSGKNLFLQVTMVGLDQAKKIVEEGGKLFVAKDGKSGAYVLKNGYMGGLFKSPSSTLKGVSKPLQQLRVEAGGTHFDAYATKLEDIYVANGFKPVARLKFDPDQAPAGWDAENSPLKGKPDVVFFVLGEGKKGDGITFESWDDAFDHTQKEASKIDPSERQTKRESEQSTDADFSDIDSAVEESRSERQEGQENNADGAGVIPETAVETPRAADGKPAWRDGVAGISSTEAKVLNNLQKILDVLGVKMYVYPDSDSALAFSEGNWGGLYDPKTKTVHINPSQIRENAVVESQGLSRTKTFSETVMEEVLHAALPMAHLYATNPGRAKAIREEIRRALSRDKALMERIDAKVESYRKDGVSEAVLFEEEVHEFLSALASDPSSVNLKIADRVRLAINKMIAAVYGKAGKEFMIKDTDSLIAIAGKFAAAKNGNATMSSRQQGIQDTSSRASKMVSPASLKKNENGQVVVSMNESVYSWRGGHKKLIGSARIEKPFRDQWHFINWWKKATKMGADPYYSGFQTADGTPIDVDRIKDYGMKRSSMIAPRDIAGDINAKASAAVAQGIFGPAVAATVRRKAGHFLRKAENSARARGTENKYYNTQVEKLKSFNNYLDKVIERSAKDLGKKFKYKSNGDMRASELISTDVIENGTSPIDVKNVSDLIESITGRKPNGRVASYQAMFEHLMEAYPDPKDRKKHFVGLLGKYIADPDLMSKTFGDRNPLMFFEDWHAESKTAVQSLMDSGELTGSLEDNISKLNVFAALTSAKNRAVPNIQAAMWLLTESEKYKKENPLGITEAFVKRATGENGAPGLSGVTKRAVRLSLRKLMATVNGDLSDFNVPATTKNHLVSSAGKAKNFNGAVDVRWKDLISFLASPFEGSAVRVGGYITSQKIFGHKVGAWLVNLNAINYGDMTNSAGQKLSDIVTVDTHVLNTVAMVLGHWYDAPARALDVGRLRAWRDYLSDSKTDGFSNLELEILEKAHAALVIPKSDRTKSHEAVIKKAAKIVQTEIDWAQGAISRLEIEGGNDNLVKSLDRQIDRVLNPQVSESQVVKRDVASFIHEMTAQINESFGSSYSAAQVGQLIFADRQVFNFVMFDEKGNKKETLAYEVYADALQRVMRPSGQPNKSQEMRASQMLVFPPENNKQNAAESPLFRNRSAAEVAVLRDGTRITDKLVNDALSTDATSMRIMEKNSEVKEGQIVGVRLNLNVMKNTGVPVQTMHNKTATGEALRYSPAVMIKNPTLFVNQNARRKIVTFQENKFPMASVNGEFMTDRLDQMNFDGVKAFFNPFNHNVFVDASGRPIKSASEATIIGNTVFLRGEIEYYDFKDPILKKGKMETPAEIKSRTERGPKYEKAVNRFKAFASRNGVEYDTRVELEAAYDNLTIESKVALSESEVASNMEEAQRKASMMLKIRQTAGKSARQYPAQRKEIIDNPNNYFTPQSIKELKGRLSEKSDQELISYMSEEGLGRLQNRNDDLGVLAAGELINRAVSRGDLESIPGIIEEVSAIGTTVGRLLRHFRELKGASPRGIEAIIKGEVARRGNRLSEEQESRLADMAGNLFRLHAEHADLVRRAIAGEDLDAELKAKTEEVKEAERLLDTFANAVIERGWGEIGTMLIQGNLLTPMSQITNVGANMINALGKVAVDAIALPVERLINSFGIDSPMKRNYSINAYMWGIRKFGTGFVEALDGIITGQEKDVSEWRVHRGFAPFRSLASAMGKGDLPLGPDGQAPLSQRIKLGVQGTLGIPAETMFRFLSLGDVPFRRYVEGIELYQAGINQGLEGEALKQFIKHPTVKAREAAEREGRKLTYQEQTGASQAAEDAVAFFERMIAKGFDWIPGADSKAISKFLVRSNLPYVRTPANILLDTLTYVSPYVAAPRIMNNLKNGDAREAAQNFGKIVVGSMVAQTAVLMVKEGIISGAIEWDEDEEKNIAYDQFPPNSINVSALRRFMRGEDTSKQPDDNFASYTKLGVMGAIIGAIVKGVDKEELSKRDYSGIGFPLHALQDSFGVGAFSSISYMMDQSFLQGMNNLVDVISSADSLEFERNFENWFRTTFQAVSATVFPNTLSAVYRGDREYLPDTRVTKDIPLSERILQRMSYTIKDRTFGLGDVPVRINWKGEPIKQTPRGNNGIAYQLFDITKSRQGEADPVSNEIWRLYEQTEDLTKVVGTPGYASGRKMNVPNIKRNHGRAISNLNKNYTWIDDQEFMAERIYLNAEQINRLMAASGKERYAEVEAFMATEKYAKMDDEERIEALNKINENYNGAIETHKGSFREHTKVLFDILQEIYDREREEV